MLPSAIDRTRAGWLRGVTYAHRGWHGNGRLENSPSAFRAAIDAGYGIECDVQLTADDQAAVIHDFVLDRLTGKTGAVRGRTTPMLAEIPLNGGEPIWLLPNLLAAIAGRVPLLIEIKSGHGIPVDRLCRAVARALEGYGGKAAVMSFDPQAVRWFARNDRRIIRGLVVTEDGNPGAFAVSRGILARQFARAEFIAHDVRDLPSRFAAAMRDRGMPLLTWTVNSPELRARAAQFADAPIAEGAGLA